jgi:hypothetical protein
MKYLLKCVFIASVFACSGLASAERVSLPVMQEIVTVRAMEPADTFVKTNVLKILLGEDL